MLASMGPIMFSPYDSSMNLVLILPLLLVALYLGFMVTVPVDGSVLYFTVYLPQAISSPLPYTYTCETES